MIGSRTVKNSSVKIKKVLGTSVTSAQLLLRGQQFAQLVSGTTALMLLGAVFSIAEANSIQNISANTISGVGTVVKIDLAEPIATSPKDFAIGSPPRIAFDFYDTSNETGSSVKEFNQNGLRSANIVQAGNRTRLVINLDQMQGYDVTQEGSSVLITLKNQKEISVSAATLSDGNSSRFSGQQYTNQSYSLMDVDFRRGRNGEGRVQVDLSDPSIAVDVRPQGSSLLVDFYGTSLPSNLQRKLDVLDFGTPIQTVDTYAMGDKVRMVIEPKGLWEHAVYQTDNKLVVEVKEVIIDPDKLGRDGKGIYTGEKLTLNFQKIDVREALNVIADFTNLNMVISDSVSGNLTLRLKDVPWDQAFDIILQSRGLDMRKNGNVIQVAPREEIAAKEKVDLAAKQEISELEEVRTESFRLSYQTVDAVLKLLTDAKQPMLSKRGSAVSDQRTSTIFVKDTPTRLDEVRKMLKQIDVPVRQVMIEARFVSAKDTFNERLGAKLSFNDSTARGWSIGSGSANGPRGRVDFAGSNVNLPVSNVGTFSLFNAALSQVLKLELAASENEGDTKSIASPRVVTKDRVAAMIKQGTQIPYQEASSSGATTTSFVDAVLSLNVTPQITPDDHINMQVQATQDVVGEPVGGAGIPSIDKKEVKTEVMVENGGTVVIGGVFEQNKSNQVDKVPVLGDIPVLGWLFKQRSVADTKTELLIFITPKIIQEALNIR